MTQTPATQNSSGRLYQKVAEELARLITAEEFPRGSRLPAERKLAERFNVSRPTIREAIIALEINNFVEVRGGSGVYVCEESPNELSSSGLDAGPFDILEARIKLEGEIAELAATKITDDELLELEDALDRMEQENKAGGALYEQADEEFHMIIVKSTQNEALVALCKMLWHLRNQSPVSAKILEKVRQAGSTPRIEEHRKIFEALRRREPALARAAMRDHLARVIRQLLDATEANAIEEAMKTVEQDRSRFSGISSTDTQI